MRKIYLLIILLVTFVNVVVAQENDAKHIVMLEGKELVGSLSDLNPDSVAHISRMKNALMDFLYGYPAYQGVTVILRKNDFPRNIGFNIPEDYLEKCPVKVKLDEEYVMYEFKAGEAKKVLSAIATDYIKYVEVVMHNPGNRKHEIKYKPDSVLNIRLKKDSTDVDSVRFYETYMAAFSKRGSMIEFQRWLCNRVVSYFPQNNGRQNVINGKVIAQFMVMPDGSIDEIEIRRSTNPDLARKVAQALASSPKWMPAIVNGKPRKMKFTIPVEFRERPSNI